MTKTTISVPAVFLCFSLPVFAQNFPPPETMKDFSDGMIGIPNTAMVVEPGDVPLVQPQADFPGTPASVEPAPPQPGDNYEGPIGVTGVIDNITTACSYSPLSHNALRGPITDIDVPGALGKYGLKMRRYYNSRSSQYWDYAICLSPGWFHEYSWLLSGEGHRIISPQGNVSDDYCGRPVGISEWWDSGQRPPNGTGTWRLADGGRIHFSNTFADYIEDPYGVRTTIAHDGLNRVSRVTEAGGRYLEFIYGSGPDYTDPAYGNQLLQTVKAWDGRGNLIESVTYTYSNVDSGGVIPTTGQHIIRKMLTGASYGDNTLASYTYTTDNVPDNPPRTFKFDPLLEECNDKRCAGPMRRIRYDYQNLGPHGAITAEKYPGVSPAVSTISPGAVFGAPTIDTFTETRGDGPTRSFYYTHLSRCQNPECSPCDDYDYNLRNGRPPQQMLDHYTDFDGNIIQLHYDRHWYIDSVTDANGYTTQYQRGDPPPDGIGEVKTIIPPGGSYPNGAYVEYVYSDHGHYIMSVRDENGKITSITRDGNNRITSITYPHDPNMPACFEEFQQYNNFGQFQIHHLKNGADERFVYDGRGLLTDKYNPKFGGTPGGNDPHTHYEYYTAADGKPGWIDRVKRVTMPANVNGYVATETYEYDRRSDNQPCAGRGLVTQVQHADGNLQSSAYNQWGNKVDESNELGENTHFEYDDYNRVVTVTRANETTTHTYRPTNGNGNSPYLHTTNNPDTLTLPTGVRTTNVYDRNFRKSSSSVAGRTTRYDYDYVGNLRFVTDPLGHITETDYDARNRQWHVWDAQRHQTTFTYDDASNVIRIDHLADGSWETKAYDALNRVIRDTVSFIGGNNPVSLTTWYIYNPSGTIQKVVDARGTVGRAYPNGDPNYTTIFAYNASDQRTRMTYPPVSGHSDFQSWDYDDAHNLKSRTTVNGEMLLFGYDNRNRKYGESWWNATAEWRYFGLDAAGRLRRATNGIGLWWTDFIADVHRNYDANGRLILDQQDVYRDDGTPITKSVSYEYDPTARGAEGKPTRLYVTGAGYDYDFRYDGMGRFEKILPHGSTNPSFQYYYDDASNETQRHNNINGVDQFYNPDNLNRPTTMDLRYHSGQALESYGYYPIGRLATVTRGNKQDQFVYYLNGELQQVRYGVNAVEAPDPDETAPAEDPDKEKTVEDFLSLSDWDPNLVLTTDRTVTYNLDYAGNRTSVNDSLSGTTGYSPNSLNQYINNVGADAIINGLEHQIASYKTSQYGYMRDEHLISVINIATGDNYSLAYDALGRCVRRTVHIAGDEPLRTPTPSPTSTPRATPTARPYPSPTPHPSPGDVAKYYFYDGERPILEYNASSWLLAKNLYGKGVDEILMRYDSTAQTSTFYYQQDHQGSVTHLTNGSGDIIEKYRYDVFGMPTIYAPDNTVRTASAVSNRFLFTGREYASLFGFYEYRARAYNPKLGRFMSEDPKLFDAGDYNLFRYCHNDPLDLTDPMGLDIAGPAPTSSMERLWAWQKHFDRSNGAIATGLGAYQTEQFAKALFGALQRNIRAPERVTAKTKLSASAALAHYLGGSGSRIQTGFYQLAPKIEARDFTAIKNAIEQARESGREVTLFVSSTRPYLTTGFNSKITFGSVTLQIDGLAVARSTGSYNFSGALTARNDIYDFDPKPLGIRSFPAEMSTRFGAALPGKPYEIEFVGKTLIDETGHGL
jgi:RHS repeat-associated protein